MRQDNPTLGIADSKSTKNGAFSDEKGYDAGKKVSGVKLHIAVDILGLPLALLVTTANVTDRNGAIELLQKNKDTLKCLDTLMVDGGYTGEKFAKEVSNIISADVKVSKRHEQHKFELEPIRWIVERTFGWLDNSRRLSKNYERKIANYQKMVTIAFISILLRRF